MFKITQLPLRNYAACAFSALVILSVGACGGTSPATPTSAAATNSGPIVVTLPPRTPDNTATPSVASDTPVPTASTPPTVPPAITASGPTIESKVANAAAFATSAPRTINQFQLVTSGAIVDKNGYGSTLFYRTLDGALYMVVLWLTPSANDSYVRYQAELASLPDTKPLALGDEAIYAPTSIHILAIIRYRNVVIDINRPDPNGTVPTVKITDAQALELATKLFNSIPKS